MKVCCAKFKTIAVKYSDCAFVEDDRLRLLAELLVRVEGYSLEPEELRGVGHEMLHYLNRKVLLEHYVFQRSLRSCTFDDIDARTELSRISSRFQ